MTINTVLKQNAIFKSLSDEAIEDLAAEFKSRILQAGEVLFNLGDPDNEIVIVLNGKIAIYMPESGSPAIGQALRIFQAGDLFGELAPIDRLPRSTSARAEVKTLIATLDSASFQNLLATRPEVTMSVMSGLSSRIRYT